MLRVRSRNLWMTCLRPSSAQRTEAALCLSPSSTCLTSWTSRQTNTPYQTLMYGTLGRATGEFARACASCERAWLAIFDCWFVFCWHWCCSVGTILDSKPTNMEHFSLLVQQNAPRLYFSLPVLVSNHSRLLVQCVCSLMHWCGISAH